MEISFEVSIKERFYGGHVDVPKTRTQ